MKRSLGTLLEDINETETYKRVASYLAYLHANVPHDVSKKGKLDIMSATTQRLRNQQLGLNEQLIEDITENYQPVYESIKQMPYGLNLDAHPGNWMILENGSLLALDKEDKGIVPIGFDIANLVMGRDDMLEIMETYWQSLNPSNHDPTRFQFDHFQLGCFNSLIYRAIAFLSAWSSSSRPSMQKKRSWAADQALDGITRIRQNCSQYYTSNQDAYKNLKSSFEEIKVMLGSGQTLM